MDFDLQRIEEVKQTLVEAIATGVEKMEIKEASLADIAEFILNNIENVRNQDQLIYFLRELTDKWPAFKSVLISEENKKRELHELETANNVLQLANNGNIDQAIELAKSVTNQQ